MSVPAQLVDGRGTNNLACVSSNGQLITAPFKYDESKFVELDTINTAYNFYKAKAGEQFVITLIRAKADRDVSATADATVVIYEATASGTTTVSKILHQEAMIRGESITLRTNLLVSEGFFVNAKTTDDDIYITIMGYYVPTVQ